MSNGCRRSCRIQENGLGQRVIKAQVLTGGRGKAGGVKLVDNTEDTYQEAKTFWV